MAISYDPQKAIPQRIVDLVKRQAHKADEKQYRRVSLEP